MRLWEIVAFDIDGTIADTIPMCIKAFRSGVSPYTNHVLDKEEILHTFRLNEADLFKTVVGQNHVFYCVKDLQEYFSCKL